MMNKNINDNIIHKHNKKNKRINNNMINYNIDELNELSYNHAIIYDKRTFCQYYRDLLKTKHNLIFSFCYGDDYNTRIIKIDL